MPRFRKKPVEIEAVQMHWHLTDEIVAFLGEHPYEWDGAVGLRIPTLEGVMLATGYDWLIRGVKGEIYPCKADIFEATYEEVTDADQ